MDAGVVAKPVVATPADSAVKNAPAPGKPVPAVAISKPMFTIQSSTATKQNQYLKLLVYAAPGVGKTTLLAGAVDVPQMNDVIMLSAEKGSMSIFDSDRVKDAEKVDIIPLNNFKTASYVKDFLTAHCYARIRDDDEALMKMQNQLFPGHDGRLRKYNTVIIDSLSEIEAFNMYDLLSIDPNANKVLLDETPTAEFKEYKQNHMRLQLLVRAFRDLPMNVLMTCAHQYDKDEVGKYHFTLNLTGKLSGQIQGFFDIVGYLTMAAPTEEKEAPRRLWVQPVGGKFDAKNRRSSLTKAFFDDPTMTSIMKAAGLMK